jgi:hypothetical protein
MERGDIRIRERPLVQPAGAGPEHDAPAIIDIATAVAQPAIARQVVTLTDIDVGVVIVDEAASI